MTFPFLILFLYFSFYQLLLLFSDATLNMSLDHVLILMPPPPDPLPFRDLYLIILVAEVLIRCYLSFRSTFSFIDEIISDFQLNLLIFLSCYCATIIRLFYFDIAHVFGDIDLSSALFILLTLFLLLLL